MLSLQYIKYFLILFLVAILLQLTGCSTLHTPQDKYVSKYDTLIQYEDWTFDEFIMYIQWSKL